MSDVKKDRIWYQYKAAEARAAMERLDTIIRVLEETHADPMTSPGLREDCKGFLAEAKTTKAQGKNTVAFWKSAADERLVWDDAVKVLKQAWQEGTMQGLTGYWNLYRSEDRLPSERFLMAARTIAEKVHKTVWKPCFYCVQLFLPVEVIIEIEGDN